MEPTEKRYDRGDARLQADSLPPGAGRGPVFAEYSHHPAVEDEVSLFDIWRILSRSKWTIIAGTALCVLASGLSALLMTPMYRAETLIAPLTERDNNSRFVAQLDEFSGIAALAGVNMERGGRKNEAIATLKSRMFTKQFIKDEKLLPVLFRKKWDAENERWEELDAEDIPTLEDAAEGDGPLGVLEGLCGLPLG